MTKRNPKMEYKNMKETRILLTKRLVFTQRQFFEELECLSLGVDISRQEIKQWVHANWKHICRWITDEGYTHSLRRSLRLLEVVSAMEGEDGL